MTATSGGDRPRKIIIAHPDRVRELQSLLVADGQTDVLVKADPHGVITEDEAYVMEPPPEVITLPLWYAPSGSPDGAS